ncbi:TPA: tail fiber assembly protein [Escherichia coli]|nr:tail fiber assembly protein [Escherichia coli]HCR3046533.1 tail fiber assembly protein [Escherichia coli]HCR3072549.1 tail fiber assembly protein [Escherichia coli]HCR3160614.1 tail fiber assembly protein [Escherichia coli]
MTFEMTAQNRTITIYNYRADTLEFIGEGDALIPPYTGLPANCTNKPAPETQPGFIAIFDDKNEQWKTIEDHRGETVFNTQTGEPIHISEPGSYPEGVTVLAPDNTWQKWNGEVWVDDVLAKKNALIEDAILQKAALLKQATEEISTLQDAVDLSIASDDEAERLQYKKFYRVMLSRVNTSDAPDIVWPEID